MKMNAVLGYSYDIENIGVDNTTPVDASKPSCGILCLVMGSAFSERYAETEGYPEASDEDVKGLECKLY